MNPALQRLIAAANVILEDRMEVRDTIRETQNRALRMAIEEVELEERVAAERPSDSVLAKELERQLRTHAKALPCGHPIACLTAGRDVAEGVQATHWCAACSRKLTPEKVVEAFEDAAAAAEASPLFFEVEREPIVKLICELVKQEVDEALERASMDHVCDRAPAMHLPAQMEELREQLVSAEKNLSKVLAMHSGTHTPGQAYDLVDVAHDAVLGAIHLCPIAHDDQQGGKPVVAR